MKRLALASLLFAAAAHAEEPCSGRHCHDGFYLRLGGGFGAYDEGVYSSLGDTGARDPDARVLGIAIARELGIGWAIRPGKILGVGSWGSRVLISDRAVRPGIDPALAGGIGVLDILGILADWYPDPTGGFHVQAGVGFAIGRSVRSTTGEGDHRAYGGGATLGLGIEFWATDNWGIGVLGRIAGGLTTDKDAGGTRYTHVTAAGPALLLTATFN